MEYMEPIMNERKPFALILFVVLLVFMPLTTMAANAPVPAVTQTLNLNPGWNAVYVEVQPEDSSPATVFNALPQGSTVWAWTGKDSPVQFIQDPNEAAVYKPKWLNISTAPAEAALNNLYAINVNTPYLVRVAGTAPVSVTVQGRPTIRHKSWVPDSFNLIGFSFSATPPTFANFFAPSNSHKNQAVYRLNNISGAWEIVNNPATTTMLSGEAFWIYCQSGSDYQGPLTVEADGSDGLNFGVSITILTLKVYNSSTIDRTVSVAQLSAANPVAFAYRSYDATSGLILTNPLSNMSPITVKAGSFSVITLAAQRGSFSGSAASVLEFSDGQGNRVRVPVTAISNPVNGYPGLWFGVATLNMVSQLSDLTGTAPNFVNGEAKPAPAALNLNLILHQDRNGQARLLKQVIVMHQDGTRNPDGTPRTNGRFVALTDDKLISNFKGVSQRSGADVGRRLSAIGFDYSPSTDPAFGTDFDDTALKCTGSISTTVTCQIILESSASTTHPTNPFLHKYHPDHDNLDDTNYTTFKKEVNRIVRDVSLDFDATPKDNPSNPPPGWGVNMLGGTYTEHIRGLAKGPIKVQGNFTIKLVSDVDVLNQ